TKYIYYLGLLILFGCISNDSDPDPNLIPREETLPDATQTGRNTLGCLVDGEVWLPISRSLTLAPLIVNYLNHSFSITARKKVNDVNQTIVMAVEDEVNSIGTYELLDESQYGFFTDLNNDCTYYTSSTHKGTLEITKLDTVNHIIAGRFEFTFQESECPVDETEEGCPVPPEERGCPTVRVTQGRFDLKYNAY
ncbi:MAG: DUF6252 family protein, partial [Bacteroidota bacterium]